MRPTDDDANVNGDHMPIDDVNRIEVGWYVDSMGDDAVKVKVLRTLLDNLLGGLYLSFPDPLLLGTTYKMTCRIDRGKEPGG